MVSGTGDDCSATSKRARERQDQVSLDQGRRLRSQKIGEPQQPLAPARLALRSTILQLTQVLPIFDVHRTTIQLCADRLEVTWSVPKRTSSALSITWQHTFQCPADLI